MSELTIKAFKFALNAHESINQKRKYTNDPYIVHPMKVATLISEYVMDDEMIAAAFLHDVLEDVAPHNNDFSAEKIRELFGENVLQLVFELTDISKPQDGNREIRKAIDREHIAKASPRAKTIKLADLIDNTETIVKYDINFAKIYLREKELLLPFLKEGDIRLYALAMDVLERAKRSLIEVSDERLDQV